MSVLIEKSLKAILVCQGQNPPLIHDLVRPAAAAREDKRFVDVTAPGSYNSVT